MKNLTNIQKILDNFLCGISTQTEAASQKISLSCNEEGLISEKSYVFGLGK